MTKLGYGLTIGGIVFCSLLHINQILFSLTYAQGREGVLGISWFIVVLVGLSDLFLLKSRLRIGEIVQLGISALAFVWALATLYGGGSGPAYVFSFAGLGLFFLASSIVLSLSRPGFRETKPKAQPATYQWPSIEK